MKIRTFKHGYATLEKNAVNGFYIVRCYVGTELHDRVFVDDYRAARDYFRAFCAIARAA